MRKALRAARDSLFAVQPISLLGKLQDFTPQWLQSPQADTSLCLIRALHAQLTPDQGHLLQK